MKADPPAPPGEDALTRIASLRDYAGSRDGLVRRFLAELAGDDRIVDALVLIRLGGGRMLYYHLDGDLLHCDETEETDQRPFGGDDLFTGGLPGAIRPDGDEILAFPVTGKGALLGALFVGIPTGARDHSLYPHLKSFASFLAIALDNVALLDEIRMESRIDHLTGIYNYRFAMEALQGEVDRARRYGRRFSIIMIDVDRFKEFNDRYGHLKGNDALREIAQLFRRSVRSVDTAAKYGGDEFLLIVPDTGREGAEKLARRLLGEIHTLCTAAGPGGVSASMGIAGCPEDGEEARTLIEHADRALYRAKAKGGRAVVA